MKVDAAYQIRPGYTALKSTPTPTFFYNIRAMETSTGPMGLDMDASKIYTGGDGNGLDVHMIKNSEWGAVALLSVSGYGAGSQSGAATWSNGNNTGVYALGDGNWEYTMTMVTTDGTSIDTDSNNNAKLLVNNGIASKYYDLYKRTTSTNDDYNDFDTNNTTKKGHAITEIRSILQTGGSGKYDYVVYPAYPFFLRGYSGYGGVLASHYNFRSSYDVLTSRAVVVCGSGF